MIQRGAVTSFPRPDTAAPAVQLMSNGHYHVAVTDAGGGSSSWNDLAITRWRDDATCDDCGSFVYLRDVASARTWSAALQPTLARADEHAAEFTRGRAVFRRRDGALTTLTTIAVAQDDDVELRRVVVASDAPATVEFTSYAELVLGARDADAAHPAFEKLFVETEWLPGLEAILCTRRPRDDGEAAPWMFHLLVADCAGTPAVSFTTDRRHFIGRARTPADAAALHQLALSGAAGAVLDPVAALRCAVTAARGQAATTDFFTGIAATREACVALAARCREAGYAQRLLAAPPSIPAGATADDAAVARYLRLAASVMYANASLRADPRIIARNARGQSGLWGYRISGDLPIVLLQIGDADALALVHELVVAQAWWRAHGLVADLAIVGGGDDALRAKILEAVGAAGAATRIDQRGGVFVLDDAKLDDDGRTLLASVARVVIRGEDGSLAQQLDARDRRE